MRSVDDVGKFHDLRPTGMEAVPESGDQAHRLQKETWALEREGSFRLRFLLHRILERVSGPTQHEDPVTRR